MPDKMRVTSFMGVIEGLATPGGTSPPNSWSGFGDHRPLCASNLMSHQVFFSPTGTAHEHTSRLAEMPSLLRHATRDRAISGAALRRCRTAAHPPVRSVHRPDPGFCRGSG